MQQLLDAAFEDCKQLQDHDQMRKVILFLCGYQVHGGYLYKDAEEAQKNASMNDVDREKLL